jgi:putative alpha-1,2-mannosidase
VGYGNTLRIETVGNTADKAHVQSVTWNGEAITDWRIAAADLVKGGTLTFTFE